MVKLRVIRAHRELRVPNCSSHTLRIELQRPALRHLPSSEPVSAGSRRGSLTGRPEWEGGRQPHPKPRAEGGRSGPKDCGGWTAGGESPGWPATPFTPEMLLWTVQKGNKAKTWSAVLTDCTRKSRLRLVAGSRAGASKGTLLAMLPLHLWMEEKAGSAESRVGGAEEGATPGTRVCFLPSGVLP